MAKPYDHITDEIQAFIEKQHIFFVATAPLSPDGHVNVSPKGLDSFRILSPIRVAYLDLTGSGNETASHTAENGRITFMFCAFDGKPLILRLYGRGRAVLPGTDGWAELIKLFPAYAGVRQIITADISSVVTSCGFAVPMMEYASQRETLSKWAEKKGEEGLQAYRVKNNLHSIDGLPAPSNLKV